jgi:hypothetical protein
MDEQETLSVQRLDYGRTTKKLGFDSRQGKETFLLPTGSRPALGAHPASYLTGIGDKAAEA